MHLQHLKITNYKSFYETTEFEFEPGFNILLGANSSGKSSVLEAIAFGQVDDNPHLSVLNSEEVGHRPATKPAFELTFDASIREVNKLALPEDRFFLELQTESGQPHITNKVFLPLILKNKGLEVHIKRDFASGVFARIEIEGMPTRWRQVNVNDSRSHLGVWVSSDSTSELSGFDVPNRDIDAIRLNLSTKIYRLHSERAIQATYGHQNPSGDLLPNGANLAYCINHLQTNNKDLFERLNALLHRVFPTIHWVSAPPGANQQFELKVQSTPTHLNRADLAVSINKVGTGVGNVLAMLYIALTSQTQRLILLEEPNSFLHPRALRELMAILADVGSQHQYFVTTHSSDVLRTIDASTVTLLEHDGQQTSIRQTAGKTLHELKAGLLDLGISLTDLHGCDKVLWVEGETEEAVFPLLLRHYLPEKAQGVAVLALHATGDFDSKKVTPKSVAEIYKTLSESSFLAPPMVAIVLDKEARRPEQIAQTEADCQGLVHFLPEVMLEDYFLHPAAIQAVISDNLAQEADVTKVASALEHAKKSEECRLKPKNPSDTTWHAAKVLDAVFRSLGMRSYHKTAHGPEIVKWLLRNEPKHLEPLSHWLKQVMQEQ
nr:AAA family ATPase [Curvibacter sp. CHRR-16]